MTPDNLHPLAQDYLRQLRRAGRQLPPERLRELVAEIEGHLSEAVPRGASDHEALEVLERLGSPGDIGDAERPLGHGPAHRRTWREWAAVILLPLGGVSAVYLARRARNRSVFMGPMLGSGRSAPGAAK